MGRPKNSVERMLIVDVDTSGDCWNWIGSIGKNGYGKTAIAKKTLLAHRVFYEHFKGVIPENYQVDHICRNRRCVNPAHLEAVTAQVNTLRSKGIAALNDAKDHCNAGHPLSGGNLYTTPDGRRQCRICRRAAVRKYQMGD